MKRPAWGHVSRHCHYCGKVGPRVQIAYGWAHRRCIPKDSLLPASKPHHQPRERRAMTTDFDLTKVALGAGLRTRDGRSARLIATDLKSHDGECVAVVDCGLYGEHAIQFHASGHISGSAGSEGVDIIAVTDLPPASSGAGGDLLQAATDALARQAASTETDAAWAERMAPGFVAEGVAIDRAMSAPTTPEPRGCPTPGAVTDSYPVGPTWVEAEQSMRLQNPPDGLYVVRNGIAVAVTAEQMLAAWDASNANCGRVTAFERAFRLLTEKKWTAPEPSLPQSGWSYQP